MVKIKNEILDLSVSAALSLAVVVVAQTTGDGGKSNDIQLKQIFAEDKGWFDDKWQMASDTLSSPFVTTGSVLPSHDHLNQVYKMGKFNLFNIVK